jgi:glycerol uptake facilitator protein
VGDQSSAGRSTIGSIGALRVGAHVLGLDQPRIWAECSAEGFGTFLILIFGAGSVAQVVAGGSGLGDHNSIAWAWGFGVMLGVYVAGRISGAHLNPAVTVSLALFKGFPRRKIAPYVLAQTLGAFIAALIVRFDYSSVIAAVDPHHTLKTQIIFSTLPGNGTLPVGIWAAFADQILGTAMLLFCIFAVTDLHNDGPPAGVTPIVVGLIVVVIGMAFGTDSGYAINPARDFGPRLASYLTGYAHAWKDQYGQYYFWVPIVGPLLGGPLGAGIYQLMIARHLAPADEQVAGLLPEEQDAS